MVYVVSTANLVLGGKQKEAIDFAIKGCKLLKQHCPAISHEVVRNQSGQGNTLHWVSKYESLAAFEEAWEKISRNPEWRAIAPGYPNFFDGPVTRTFMQILE